NVAWSHDGTRLVYYTFEPGDPVFVADGAGGNPRRIYASEDGAAHNHFVTWSLDDRWLYYAHGLQTVSEYDVWRIPPSGSGRPERLTHHNSDVRYVTPIDSRTVLYVAPDDEGLGPWLWVLDVERKVTRRVLPGLERYVSIAANANGRKLIASVSTSTAT